MQRHILHSDFPIVSIPEGYVTAPATPPGTTACTALTELTCPCKCKQNISNRYLFSHLSVPLIRLVIPATNCLFAELIYVKNNDGYVATCKTGSLVTDVVRKNFSALYGKGEGSHQKTGVPSEKLCPKPMCTSAFLIKPIVVLHPSLI